MKNLSYVEAVESASHYKRLYQYTTYEALEKIITNNSLRLTRIDLLNDGVENQKVFKLWKNKVYVSCFTHREDESYFFWETYAKKVQKELGYHLILNNRSIFQFTPMRLVKKMH